MKWNKLIIHSSQISSQTCSPINYWNILSETLHSSWPLKLKPFRKHCLNPSLVKVTALRMQGNSEWQQQRKQHIQRLDQIQNTARHHWRQNTPLLSLNLRFAQKQFQCISVIWQLVTKKKIFKDYWLKSIIDHLMVRSVARTDFTLYCENAVTAGMNYVCSSSLFTPVMSCYSWQNRNAGILWGNSFSCFETLQIDYSLFPTVDIDKFCYQCSQSVYWRSHWPLYVILFFLCCPMFLFHLVVLPHWSPNSIQNLHLFSPPPLLSSFRGMPGANWWRSDWV